MIEHPSPWLRYIDAAVRSWKIYYLATATNMISTAAGIVMFLTGLPSAVTTGDFASAGVGLFLAATGSAGLWKDGTESLERGLRDLATLSRSAVSRLTRAADGLNGKADEVKKALGR